MDVVKDKVMRTGLSERQQPTVAQMAARRGGCALVQSIMPRQNNQRTIGTTVWNSHGQEFPAIHSLMKEPTDHNSDFASDPLSCERFKLLKARRFPTADKDDMKRFCQILSKDEGVRLRERIHTPTERQRLCDCRY